MASPTVSARSRKTDLVLHLFFGLLFAGTVVTFFLWARGEIGHTAHLAVLVLTILFGSFMAFNIGGNDVANSFGTSVGAGTLTMKQALIVAAIFEVGGAVIAGGEVTDTVKSGIVDLDAVHLVPMDFAFIMMSALLGAALWLLVATKMGWPVSTTHAIVGGIVGAAVTLGFVSHNTDGSPWAMVKWSEIGNIVISWFLSPVLGGIAAYGLFWAIKRTVLVYNDRADKELRAIREARARHREEHKRSFERLSELQQISYTNAMARDAEVTASGDYSIDDLESEYYRDLYRINKQAEAVHADRALTTIVPLLAAVGAMIITSMMLFKGLKHLGLHLGNVSNLLIILMVGATVWMLIYIFARTMQTRDLDRSTFVLFSWMQVFTASAFAFSHGSNDIANAVGPFAAVLDVLRTDQIRTESAVPMALMVTAGVALVAGLWFIGRTVIQTVGTGLTEIHPASGFAAELSAAAVVMAASMLGLPVSSTHILIGAVLGVGLVNRAANWKLMRPIALAWVITVPVAAGIGAVSVLALRAMFG